MNFKKLLFAGNNGTKKQPTEIEKKKARRRGFTYLSIYMLFLPIMARADVAGTLNDFFGYLTGDVGKTVAALAIVGAGFGCFHMGKMSKMTFVGIVLGIGLVFGAKAMLGVLTA